MAIIDKKDQPLQALKQHEYPVASPGEEQAELTTAARDVLAERRRQVEVEVEVEVEGFSLEHDSQYDLGELPAAAACYALFAQSQVLGLRKSEPDHAWPWNLGWWKPGDARSALVKAGALILAEIERSGSPGAESHSRVKAGQAGARPDQCSAHRRQQAGDQAGAGQDKGEGRHCLLRAHFARL